MQERGPPTVLDLDEISALRDEFSRFMFSYKFGMEEDAIPIDRRVYGRLTLYR